MDNRKDFVGDRSVNANVAIWILMTSSALFLAGRLWCRHRSTKLWWDDLVLSISWVLLLIAAAMISRLIAVGPTTDRSPGAEKRYFFQLQNGAITLATIATSWTKVAFAITLTRLVRHRIQLWFLWAIIVTANLILIPGITSTLIPACIDPRARFRPVTKTCWDLQALQTLGGATILYGGVIDILLALFPWLILRKTQLESREKIGLAVAMSLGALTGVIVILRTFYGLVQGDYNFEFMIFISLFNFLEPCVTIIAQAIPMFRALFINTAARRGTYYDTYELSRGSQRRSAGPNGNNNNNAKKYIISKPASLSSSLSSEGLRDAVAPMPLSLSLPGSGRQQQQYQQGQYQYQQQGQHTRQPSRTNYLVESEIWDGRGQSNVQIQVGLGMGSGKGLGKGLPPLPLDVDRNGGSRWEQRYGGRPHDSMV